MKNPFDTLDDILLKGAQKVVDKAYDIGYDKYDVLRKNNSLTSASITIMGLYGVMETMYSTNNHILEPAIFVLSGLFLKLKSDSKINQMEEYENDLLSKNLKPPSYRKIPKYLRSIGSSILLSASAICFYAYFSEFNLHGFSNNSQSQQLGKYILLSGGFLATSLVANDYLIDTTPKPPSAKKSKLWDRIKEAAREYITPKPELIPIPVKKPDRRYR
jgi:hypothetical protein